MKIRLLRKIRRVARSIVADHLTGTTMTGYSLTGWRYHSRYEWAFGNLHGLESFDGHTGIRKEIARKVERKLLERLKKGIPLCAD